MRRRSLTYPTPLQRLTGRLLPVRLARVVHDARTAMPHAWWYPLAAVAGAAIGGVAGRRRGAYGPRFMAAVLVGGSSGPTTVWLAFAASALDRWAGRGRLGAALLAECLRGLAPGTAGTVEAAQLARALARGPLPAYGVGDWPRPRRFQGLDERYGPRPRLEAIRIGHDLPGRPPPPEGEDRAWFGFAPDPQLLVTTRIPGSDPHELEGHWRTARWEPGEVVVDGQARPAEFATVTSTDGGDVTAVVVRLVDALVTVESEVALTDTPRLRRLDHDELRAAVLAGHRWWSY